MIQINGVVVHVGQVWRRRDGSMDTIRHIKEGQQYPLSGDKDTYSAEGLVISVGSQSDGDLVSLASEPSWCAVSAIEAGGGDSGGSAGSGDRHKVQPVHHQSPAPETTPSPSGLGEVKRGTPPERGLRFNKGKLRPFLLPADATVELMRVHTIGSIKYDDFNWMKGMPFSEMIDCAERHLLLWKMGLDVDPDTKCHHLALAAWNVLGLLTYQLRGLGTDDRQKLPVDEQFNWLSGPAAQFQLGMSKEEMELLRAKYAHLRNPKGDSNG